MGNNSDVLRVDSDFKEWIKDISRVRIRNGKDLDQIHPRRITQALIRVPKLKDILINADLK
jgi:hypothetical protein